MKANLVSFISALILSGLLVSLLVGTHTVEVAGAPTPRTTYHPGDSYTTVYYQNEISPPDSTKQPIVTILTPANNTVIASNNVTLTFNLTLEASTSFYPITLGPVYYKSSWQSNNITIDVDCHSSFMSKTLQMSITAIDVPEGPQWMTVYAYAVCEYETGRENVTVPNTPTSILLFNFLYVYSNIYRIGGSSSVNFTIDTSPTKIPSIPPENGSTVDNVTTTPLYAVGITAVVIVAVSVAELLYFKKYHKRIPGESKVFTKPSFYP